MEASNPGDGVEGAVVYQSPCRACMRFTCRFQRKYPYAVCFIDVTATSMVLSRMSKLVFCSGLPLVLWYHMTSTGTECVACTSTKACADVLVVLINLIDAWGVIPWGRQATHMQTLVGTRWKQFLITLLCRCLSCAAADAGFLTKRSGAYICSNNLDHLQSSHAGLL